MTTTASKKHCPDCGGDFPTDTDHFYRNRGRKDGLDAYCKTCSYARSKVRWRENYYPKHKEEHIARVVRDRIKRKEQQEP